MKRLKSAFFIFCLGVSASFSISQFAVASPKDCDLIYQDCMAGDATACAVYRYGCHGNH